MSQMMVFNQIRRFDFQQVLFQPGRSIIKSILGRLGGQKRYGKRLRPLSVETKDFTTINARKQVLILDRFRHDCDGSVQ